MWLCALNTSAAGRKALIYIILCRFKNLDFPSADLLHKPTMMTALRDAYDRDWKVMQVDVEDLSSQPGETAARPGTQLMRKTARSVGAFLGGFSTGRAESTAGQAQGTDELSDYLSLPQKTDKDIDVLEWWKTHATSYPTLSQMARQYLAQPASSSAVERVFNRAGRLHDDFKKNMKEETLQDCLLVANNY